MYILAYDGGMVLISMRQKLALASLYSAGLRSLADVMSNED
jgi:hypothetical protein